MGIEYVELNERVRELYGEYAMATIVDRALPDVRDGFLPIHRRIMFAMWNKGLIYNKPYAKSSEPVSETMKIHQHGDSSIYGSLALLTDNNETLLYPLIDGDGSFGKVYSTDSPSHMRYTFCRLNKFAEECFYGINKNSVNFIGDGEEHPQPLVLPVTYPSILVKPNNAIAVGMACKFGTFPLSEVCDTTIAYIKDKNINIIDYLTPDFSTGGYLIYNKEQLENIYNTGKGSIILRAKYRFDKDNNCIEVYEIPYTTTVTKIVKEITAKMSKYKEILDVRDETGFDKIKNKECLKIAIDVKKNTNIDLLMFKLFKETSLEKSFSYNMNCLVDYKPKVLGVKAILDEWLKFRRECIVRTYQYDIKKMEKTLHLLSALKLILLDIDKAIEIIRHGENEVIDLMNYFKIDMQQAEFIVNYKLKNINKKHIIEQIEDIENLNNALNNMKTIIKNEDSINSVIIKELERVKTEYSQPRKTEILYNDNIEEISKEDLIEDYTCTLIRTKENYFKKTRKYSESQKIKDNDEVVDIIQCNNKDKAGFFTNKGNLYYLNIWEQSDCLPSNLGQYLYNLLPLEKDENIIGMIIISPKSKDYVIIVYENGKISKTPIISYITKNNRIKVGSALCLTNGEIITIKQITEDIDIKLIDIFNNEKMFNTSELSIKSSKNNSGIYIWNSKRKGFKIVNINTK